MSGSPAGILEYFTAKESTSAQTESADKAMGVQNRALDIAQQNYEQQRADFQPYADVGKRAIPDYEKMLRGGYDMKESPAAQYQLQKGTQALNRALASRGLSGSGNAAQRLTELNQSVAANDWNQQYSRILDALKLGTGASASMGSAGNANTAANQSGAVNLGNILQNQGAANASLYSGLSGMMNNKGGDVYSGIKKWQSQNNAGGSAAGANWGAAEGTPAYAEGGMWFI